MGMSDLQSSPKLWRISVCAKAEGFVTAELKMGSSQAAEKKGLSFYLARIRRKCSRRHQEPAPVCDASISVKARLFLLKIRIAAGRLRELRLQSRSQGGLTITRSRSKVQSCASTSFQCFKGSSRSDGILSWLPRLPFQQKKTRGSLFLCCASMGAMAMYSLHHASSWATYFPLFALNVGSRAFGWFAKFIQRKCDSLGFEGAACFWQGVRGAVSVFQIVISLLRSFFSRNLFVGTSMVAVFLGIMLFKDRMKMVQGHFERKNKRGTRFSFMRVVTKVLMVMELMKRIWSHVDMKVCLLVLLLAFLVNMLNGTNK
ncbi:hypothetical protein KP509_17G038700 [Ceratopteris richardii]|uniref:Uncharacterized protein n=1 Tax=Ceratopteris richardii TaxID=49495 RepID=A0A8T2STP6_CERRI|nr:hypothetical protein KP509_17G038700 [Ceratopteris richardii]